MHSSGYKKCHQNSDDTNHLQWVLSVKSVVCPSAVEPVLDSVALIVPAPVISGVGLFAVVGVLLLVSFPV